MAKFRIDTFDELARQLRFSPHETRIAQLQSAEELLHSLEVDKAYPLDYVIFRITGYHPRHAEQLLFPGEALQNDLAQLIEKVSDSLDMKASALSEPVLSIDDVTERFNVTSKTIQRWRRKGLVARKFIFNDGKRRVGFLLSSVERFVNCHREQVSQAGNFSQVGEIEKQNIVRFARRLAGECRCCVGEITRRIARKLNRSPLTILHVVRKHDADHPEDGIFVDSAQAMTDAQKAIVLRKAGKGRSIGHIARRIGKPRAEVYRVMLDDRIVRLQKRKMRFVDDELYHQDDAAGVIRQLVSQEDLLAKQSAEEMRVPRDLPAYLQDLYRTPLLSASRERALFLKFNFEKYLFVSARQTLDPELARRRDLDWLEGLLGDATQTKNGIVQANLRLVVSVARKHLRAGLSLMELISEGNITLMRAVESFDVHKGNRFSTYATLALMKGFARSVPQMLEQSRRNTGDVQVLMEVADRRDVNVPSVLQRDEVQHLLSRLSNRERAVVSAHYGLDGHRQNETMDDAARRLGLTRSRLRQIQHSALSKLKQAAGVKESN